jgi:hypothetical protein
MPSKGYTSSARVSSHPGAYIEIPATDFGVAGGTLANPGNVGSGGSLANGSIFDKITWITAEGESGPSTEGTVTVTGGPNGSITVVKPATPTNGATVLGWRVYTSSTTNTELLNAAANSTTEVQQNFVTAQGTLAGFPLTTTTVHVLILGAGQAIPLVDFSGAQAALPAIPVNTTVDYFFRVPNTGSQWKVQKTVEWMRPQGLAEPGGVLVGPMDPVAPVYPGTSQSVTASIATPVYMVIGGYLFVASATGTTAATFIGFSAFNINTFGVTTDGTVKWTCLGRRILVRCHFGNNTGGVLTPVTQEYDLFEV